MMKKRYHFKGGTDMKMSEVKCGFCKRGKEVEDECGELHHVDNTSYGKSCTAHHKCMQYSALLVQYKSEHFGGFKISKVFDELSRGRAAKCSICKSKKGKNKGGNVCLTGATCGCAVKHCRKTFHYYCAKTSAECITKRLVVSFKSKGKITVLYRVFCSKKHEIEYRQNLKKYSKDMNRNEEESEAESDFEGRDDEANDDDDGSDDDADLLEGGFDLSSQMFSEPNGHDTSYILSGSNIGNGSVKKGKQTSDLPIIGLKRSISHSSLSSEENPRKSLKLDGESDNESDNDSERETKDKNENLIQNKKSVPSPSKKTKKDKETINSDYCLCILSSDKDVASQRKEINMLVKRNLAVNEIVIWQDITSYTLNTELTPYFIHAVSKAIKDNLHKNLQNLLFSEKYLRDKCVSDYEFQLNFIKDLKDPTVAKNVLQSTWKSISKNLQEASAKTGAEIGNVIPVNGANVLVLLVGDDIDKKNVIRKKLKTLLELIPKPSSVFKWENDSRLKKGNAEDLDPTEVEILVSKIMKSQNEIGEVKSEPKDKILLRSNVKSNMVNHILHELKSTGFSTDKSKSNCLVLVSHLDPTIVNCGNYIIKLLHNIITNNGDKYSTFTVVLPVTSLPSTFNIQEKITNCVDLNVHVTIYSAYNPKEQNISYILAKIKIINPSTAIGVTNSASKSATKVRPCVEDDERPSTSGSNKKKRLKPSLTPSALNLQHMLKQSA